MDRLASALLNPRRIALIGGSSDPKRLTARAQVYLRKHGFTGELFPINPSAETILGERAYPRLADVSGEIDLAYLLLGTQHVEGQIAAVAEKRIPVAAILADGFAEAGPEGRALQERLLATAKAAGVRLLGPNSMGLVNLNARTACSVNAALEADSLPAGRIALVSQSGSMMGAIMARGAPRRIGFSHLIGTGNEADLTASEIAGMLVEDQDVDAVLLFLEAIRAPEKLAAAACRAHALGKPIIAFKLGRSSFGAELAGSHTGALAGSDAAADAFFRANGIARVMMIEALLEAPALFIGRKPLANPRRTISVMTTTGGGGAMAVDALGVVGIETCPPDAAAVAGLEAAGLPHHGRMIDVTVQAGLGKPIAAFLVPQADASLRLLGEAGIPAFRTPESCADVIRAFFDWRAPRAEAPAPAISHSTQAHPDEADARRLFAAFGLDSPFAVMAASDAVPAGLRYPVALKILSPDLAHKTEVGGVALNIPDPAALESEAAAMLTRVRARAPAARITGFLVQPMVKGLAEAIIGFRRDPEAGPIILVGAGGIMAELHRDTALRLAPVDEAEARAMVAEVKGLKPLAGWRGLPRGDLDALARAVVAASRLAAHPGVAEAEINPLIIHAEGQGVTVADAWVVPASP